MALIVTSRMFFAKPVQTGRTANISASAPVVSFRPLHPLLVMADRRMHGVVSLRTGLLRTSLCFATAGTTGKSRDHSPLLDGSTESEEAGNVTKKAVPSLLYRDFSGTPYVPAYVMLPVLCILKFHVYAHTLIISWLRT
jgi:hypothetical protein